jgi:F1F0 ATPase subunit 2
MNVDVTALTIAPLLGLALGAVYFALLHRAVRLQESNASATGVLGLLLLRGAAAVVVFWGLAQLGAAALLAGLAGFLVARHLARRLVEGRG